MSARPTTTITTAEIAGTAATTRPGIGALASSLPAWTTAMPSAVRVAARPTRERDDQDEAEPDPVLRDGAEQHDERGRARDQAGRRAERDQASPPAVVVMVVMAVVVVVVVRGRGLWPTLRSRPRSTAAPTPTTRRPETSVSHG